MYEVTTEEAIQKAATILGINKSVPGRALLVQRLGNPSEDYYLVEFGYPNSVVGVAAVNAHTNNVGVYAHLPGIGPHLSVTKEEAINLAADGKYASTQLIWTPCALSKSPLYPIWEVKTDFSTKYVDQQRNVQEELEKGQLG
jgi:hypothetical protein